MYRKISDGWMKHWDFELIDVIMLEISLFISYFSDTITQHFCQVNVP